MVEQPTFARLLHRPRRGVNDRRVVPLRGLRSQSGDRDLLGAGARTQRGHTDGARARKVVLDAVALSHGTLQVGHAARTDTIASCSAFVTQSLYFVLIVICLAT